MTLRILVFGAGWLGTRLVREWPDAVLHRADIADEEAVACALDDAEPTHVVNAAGKTGRPNVDALEAHPVSTYRSNVVGPVLLASACRRRGLHLTHISSGCIYQGDNGGRGWREEDPPNFQGSLYARTKAVCEAALRDFDALQLRIRLPISARAAPRNLLTKLIAYEEIVRADNSVTVLEDLWRPARALLESSATGVWNVVNPGVERHDELLGLWRERVDPGHRARVIHPEQLDARLVAARSNCILDTTRLRDAGLELPPLATSLPRLVDAYARNLRAAVQAGE